MHDQQDAVYVAEERAWEELGLDLSTIDPSTLRDFARTALSKAGCEGDAEPVFALDVPDDHDLSGWHAGKDGVIHLHPRLLRPEIVLHELAHWIRPRDGHGPQFCGMYLSLVCGTLGTEAADELETAFEEFGVRVDRSWYAGDDDAELRERSDP